MLECYVCILARLGNNDRRLVVGICRSAFALTVNVAMLVRRYITWIRRSALAFSFNEGMLVRRNVIGILCTAGAYALNVAMLMGRAIVITNSLQIRCFLLN